MNLNEEIFDIPTEHMANVFGGCDKNIKKIERALHERSLSEREE